MSNVSHVTTPISPLLTEPAVRSALLEDLGRAGDITTDSIVPADASARLVMVTRAAGRIAGLDVAAAAFRLLDPKVHIDFLHPDGTDTKPGEVVMVIEGAARAMLTAERAALNFVGHLSGIATVTHDIVAAIGTSKPRVCCTRKTTPGLRVFEKYAVRIGGGANHRFGLDDGVLIKDNHIAIAGGVREAVERARRTVGHMVKVEVEVDTLDQLAAVLGLGVDAVLLDNMDTRELREAVRLVDGRAITEASGRITAETATRVASTGVDIISVGWLTHSAPVLDVGLDFVRESLRRGDSAHYP